MNNTFNITAMDTVYPFIPMYPNGQPQGNFLVNGLSAPVLIPKRAASNNTRHEWFGYLKVMAPATCFLHLHAHSSISLSIPAKDLELSTEPGSSTPPPPPDPVRPGILLVPYCPSTPARPGVGSRVLHCPGKRQGRRARPGLLPFRGDDASRQGGRNGADAG